MDGQDRPGNPQVESLIRVECDAIADLLISKNRRYGNSALEPVRIFSRASVVEQILVRIDDKLSRLAKGAGDGGPDEDTVMDLIGYLVLLRVARAVDGQRVVTAQHPAAGEPPEGTVTR